MAAAAAVLPHILLLLIDNWGHYNAGFHGNTEMVTPVLDELVTTGVQLSRLYTFKYCSPTRSAIFSGRDPTHVNVFNFGPQVFNLSDPVAGFPGIPRNMTGLAAKLKPAGYATHLIGKWDCGMSTVAHLPSQRGFDTSFGYLDHYNDYWTMQLDTLPCEPALVDLWNTSGPAIGANNSAECSQTQQGRGCVFEDSLLAQRVLEIAVTHDPAVPLFLVWSTHAVHYPLEAPQAALERFAHIDDPSRRTVAAMLNVIDTALGQVIDMLKARGLWDQMLVLGMADNGGQLEFGSNNYPLRGGMYSNWEGGVRAAAFAAGGLLPASVRGSTYDGLMAAPDLYSTVCGLAGVDSFDTLGAAAGLPPVDGVDFWPALSGANLTSPRRMVLLGSPSNTTSTGMTEDALAMHTLVQGIIVPPFKLLIGPVDHDVWTGPVFPNSSTPAAGWPGAVRNCGDPLGTAFAPGPGCLFNIWMDPTEHLDLAADPAFRAVRDSLRAMISEAQAGVFDPRRGTVNHSVVCAAAAERHGGFLGPFLPLEP